MRVLLSPDSALRLIFTVNPFNRPCPIVKIEALRSMSNRRFHVYIEKDKHSGLFAARCLEMSVFSQGGTEQEALRNIREAISLHLETLEDELKGKKLVEVEL